MPMYKGSCARCLSSWKQFEDKRGYNVSSWPKVNFPHRSVLNTKFCNVCYHYLRKNNVIQPLFSSNQSTFIVNTADPQLTDLRSAHGNLSSIAAATVMDKSSGA